MLIMCNNHSLQFILWRAWYKSTCLDVSRKVFILVLNVFIANYLDP